MPATPPTTVRLSERDRENLRLVRDVRGLRSLAAAIGYLAEEAAARLRAEGGGAAPAAPKKSRKSAR